MVDVVDDFVLFKFIHILWDTSPAFSYKPR